MGEEEREEERSWEKGEEEQLIKDDRLDEEEKLGDWRRGAVSRRREAGRRGCEKWRSWKKRKEE